MLLDVEFWKQHARLSAAELNRLYPERYDNEANWRRAKRKAQQDFPELFGEKTRRGIGVFDLHHPRHQKKLWNNILKFTADFDPDVFVFGGDNQDLEVISHWVGNKRRKVEGMRLKKDYASFNKQVLKPVDEVLRHDAERHFLLGNHEDWVEQYIDEHPEVEGFFEVRNNLDLDKWTVYDYGQTAKVGKLHFMHGEYINLHNAHKTAQVYGRNMVYGHGHTYQAHTITAPLDVESHTATQVPCACELNPHYRLNKPNAWVNGFCVFHIQPSGNFNLYPCIAIDGCFTAPDGTYYG